MNRKLFTWISVAAVAAVVLLLLLDSGEQDSAPDARLFLPELAARVNEVELLQVSSGDGVQVSLERDDTNWTVRELNGYPAHWQRIRDLLLQLSEARIIELKTANPEYHARLGVENLDSAAATGAGLVLVAGELRWSLIAGNEPELQQGQYLREAGNDQSVLADVTLNLPMKPIEWTERQVLNIPAALVAGVEIMHADGERVALSKVSADDSDYALETLPEGRELQSVYTLNAMAGMFAMLQMEGVRPDDDPEAGEVSATNIVTLFSGQRVTAQVLTFDDSRWLRISAAAAPPDEDESAAPDAIADTDDGATGPDMADDINARTAGWLFRVSESRMDTMTRRNENLLKPLEDDTAASE